MRLSRVLMVVASSVLLTAPVGEGDDRRPVETTSTAPSTSIQTVIFERHGCTSVTCHSGAVPAGGLDLSPGVAYDNLVDQPPQSVRAERFPGLARVVPGNKARSLLWLNLASATLPEQWRAPLRPCRSAACRR